MSKKPITPAAVAALVGNHKFNALKKAFGLDYKFVDATLADGTAVKVEPSVEEGASVLVITAEGEEVPAPDGSHELADGVVIVTEGGIIIEVIAAVAAADQPAPVKLEGEQEAVDATVELMNVLESLAERVTALEAKVSGVATEMKAVKAGAVNFATVTSLKEVKDELTAAKAVVVKMAEQSSTDPIKKTTKTRPSGEPTAKDLEEAAVANFSATIFGKNK
jgi:hypothetical protein